MEIKSTFEIRIGDALIHQQDVMAWVEMDDDGWWISAIYADALEIGGKCPRGDAYVEIPRDHYLHKPIADFFEKECSSDIDAEWAQIHRAPRYYSRISAGRTL